MSQSLSSPLTLQMLLASNGGVNQFPQDPAMAPSVARLQLAQSMMQNGMSAAPTEKFGALSRIGQALLGNYVFDKANTGIQDVLTQRAQQAGAASNWITGGPQTPPGVAPGMPPSPTPAAASSSTPPVQTFATQLASAEAPTPDAVNKQGYSGQFQFGTSRLASTGMYTPAAGENLKANEWKGTFNIPGFPQVKTQADFLANPQAQNAALGIDVANTDKAIANTPGAGAYDQNGLRAVAHLGGIKGMQDFVASGGRADPHDPNQTHLSDYYRQFSGNGRTAPTASVSSPAPGVAPAGPNPWEVIRRAGAVLTNPAFINNPQAQAAAHQAMEVAKLQIQTGSYIRQADGTYVDAYTNKPVSAPTPALNYQETKPGIYTSPGAKPEFAPTPRTVTTVQGKTIAVGPGGSTTTISDNPTGIGGNAPENETMRILAELGPKVVNGTATDQEKATYNTAATTYQNFKTGMNPATQQVVQMPERPLPAGMPQPGQTTPGTPPQVTPLTQSARGPAIQQAVTTSQGSDDAKAVSEELAAAMKGHSALGATAAIRAELPSVATGPTADQRLLLSRYGALAGIPDDELKSIIGTAPVSGELLQKKLFEIQTHALRLLGAREPGSVLQAYQKNFPAMASQPGTIDTMTRMMDMDQIYNEDMARGKQGHFNEQMAGVGRNEQYGGMGGFQPPDPRIYVSAAMASGGRPFAEWSHGLTQQQQTDALKLAARIYPDATALDAKGVVHRFQTPQGGGGG